MKEKKAARLSSLDAFRGLTIAGMILVNTPGTWESVYGPLQHAPWHGWTPTDLIFPFFLFIIGVAMTFSFGKFEGPRRALYWKITRRSSIIFALGLFLNLFPEFDFANLRVAGVLPRIGVVYFFASIIFINTSFRSLAWTTGGLLAGYWAMMALIPVPGHGAGVLTPEGNLAAYVDSFLLPGRMWQGTWDPEGLLSTIPAIATTLLGVFAGHLLHSRSNRTEITAWLFVSGWALCLAGLFWGIWFPINKNIWTSSYVLFTAGAAHQFLGVCYWLIDVKNYGKWFRPAIAIGMNPIALYVLSGMLISVLYAIPIASGASVQSWIFQTLFASWASALNASLAFALSYVVLWWLVAELLYRRRVFIKI